MSEYYDVYIKQCKNLADGMETALKIVDIYSSEEVRRNVLIDFIENGFGDTSHLDWQTGKYRLLSVFNREFLYNEQSNVLIMMNFEVMPDEVINLFDLHYTYCDSGSLDYDFEVYGDKIDCINEIINQVKNMSSKELFDYENKRTFGDLSRDKEKTANFDERIESYRKKCACRRIYKALGVGYYMECKSPRIPSHIKLFNLNSIGGSVELTSYYLDYVDLVKELTGEDVMQS